jgi:hypothetical protein
MVVETSTGCLSGGKPIRAMEGNFTQAQMFNLQGKFDKRTEHIAGMKDIDDALDVDDALNVSGIYPAVMGDRWVRTCEYCVYGKDYKAPLGREILWIENGALFRKLIPDVPVTFGGREMSLQKVAGGMGVYDSIGLLQITRTGEKEFTVSPTDLDALEGRVRAVRFMNNGWAHADSRGFPDAAKAASPDNPAARYGWMRTIFDKGATGWHGSFARGVGGDGGRSVVADLNWSIACGVAVVGRDAHDAKKHHCARC